MWWPLTQLIWVNYLAFLYLMIQIFLGIVYRLLQKLSQISDWGWQWRVSPLEAGGVGSYAGENDA